MEKDFVDSWERHKGELKAYLETCRQKELGSYQALVKLLFRVVINPDLKHAPYDTEKMVVIDDGDYQGAELYILHRSTYQPYVEDYIYTYVYYGSCSFCDILQGIRSQGELWPELNEDKAPSPHQVTAYMQLLLHLLQRIKRFQGNDMEDFPLLKICEKGMKRSCNDRTHSWLQEHFIPFLISCPFPPGLSFPDPL